MSTPAHALGPMPFLQLLDEVPAWWRAHLRGILLPTAIPVCTAAGAIAVVQGFWFRHLPGHAGGSPDWAAFIAGGAAFVLALFLLVVLQVLGYVAMIVAACRAVRGEPVSMAQAWRYAARPGALGTVILSGLAVIAGIFCCFFPGIYVGLLFAMVVPVMVYESTFGTDALARSARLATHNPSRSFTADPRVKIFVMNVAAVLLGYGLALGAQLLVVAVQQLVLLRMMGSGEGADPGAVMARVAWMEAPSHMLGAFTGLLTHLFTSFGIALLYHDLVGRREGADLEAAITRLSGGAESAG